MTSTTSGFVVATSHDRAGARSLEPWREALCGTIRAMRPKGEPVLDGVGLSRRAVISTVLGAFPLALPRRSTGQPSVTDHLPFAIEGARWWNGQRFEQRTGLVVDGRFARASSTRAVRTVDLSGTYVVPPYGDAHHHGIGTGDPARDLDMIARYRRDGVLYAQILGESPLLAHDRSWHVRGRTWLVLLGERACPGFPGGIELALFLG